MDEERLMPFQRAGVARGVELDGRILIGDEVQPHLRFRVFGPQLVHTHSREMGGLGFGSRIAQMGLGKTVQAIALAARYRDEWPLLILCPTSMCLPWCEELEKWLPFLRPGDINLVKSQHNGALRVAPITILSYGLVTHSKEKER